MYNLTSTFWCYTNCFEKFNVCADLKKNLKVKEIDTGTYAVFIALKSIKNIILCTAANWLKNVQSNNNPILYDKSRLN